MQIHIHTLPTPLEPQPDDDIVVELKDLTPELVFKDGSMTVMNSRNYDTWEELRDDIAKLPPDKDLEIVRYRMIVGG